MLLLLVAGGIFSGATAAPVAAAAPLVRADPTPAANCSALPSATDQDLVAALGWVCGAGKVECSAINPGAHTTCRTMPSTTQITPSRSATTPTMRTATPSVVYLHVHTTGGRAFDGVAELDAGR